MKLPAWYRVPGRVVQAKAVSGVVPMTHPSPLSVLTPGSVVSRLATTSGTPSVRAETVSMPSRSSGRLPFSVKM